MCVFSASSPHHLLCDVPENLPVHARSYERGLTRGGFRHRNYLPVAPAQCALFVLWLKAYLISLVRGLTCTHLIFLPSEESRPLGNPHAHCSSSVCASFRSAVSNPSVNQAYTSVSN